MPRRWTPQDLLAEAKAPMAILDHLKRDLRQSGLDKEAAVDVAEAISRIVDRFR